VAGCVSGGAASHRPLCLPQPVQLCRQRPGAVLQVLQVAAAVERPPVDAARPTAGVAGVRGARMGVVGPWPTGTSVAAADPRAGRDGDLPWPAGLPATHQVSPPLPGCQALTSPPADRHGQVGAASCSSTVRSGGRVCRARSGCRRRPLEHRMWTLRGLRPGRRLRGRAAAARPCDGAHEHMHHGRPPRRAGAWRPGPGAGPAAGQAPLPRATRFSSCRVMRPLPLPNSTRVPSPPALR